ncbi:MAG: efflux RND transporter periplasmic adaptor subunit [Bauldia sp.]
MSALKQVLLSLMVVAIAAAGWFAYERGTFSGSSGDVTAGQVPAGGPPGQGGGGFARGGQAPVVTALVETDETGLEVQAIGTVAAARAITLFPEVTGVVSEVAFTPGSRVAAGQTLIRLSDADQQVAVEKAKIAVANARSALARAEQLAKTNNISVVALADAKGAVTGAEIDLKGAEIELAKRTLTAPFAGVIGLSDIAVGDLVTSSRAIATLDDMSTVRVAFDVPEQASGRVAVGQAVTASTAALAGERFAGMIGAVDSRVDPTARTLKVEATLPNDAALLKPGMALRVALTLPGERRLAVPSLSVQWDRGGAYVWKLDRDTAHRVGIDIVGRLSGTVVVVADLAAGEEVVTEGLQRLREGATVSRVGGPGVAAETGGEAAGARRPGSS